MSRHAGERPREIDDRDEGPSEEDLARFDRDDAECPACGAGVSDLATLCHDCGSSLDAPSAREASRRAIWPAIVGVLVAALLLAFLMRIF